jgi:biopolymer transport protein ExbB/TolQ
MLAIHPPETAAAAAAFRPPQGRLQTWFGAFGEGDAAAYRYLLVLRFAVLNVVALALLGAAWLQGWVGLVLDGDTTRLVSLIAVVFLAGLLECGRKLWQTSVELDQVAGASRAPAASASGGRSPDGYARAIAGSLWKLRLSARIAPIRHIANSLVFLGLIGTVIGFIIALSGIDPDAAADVASIGPMVSTLISGMSVALYTTLVGAILNVWLMVNYRLLESGTVRLLAALVERGERDV